MRKGEEALCRLRKKFDGGGAQRRNLEEAPGNLPKNAAAHRGGKRPVEADKKTADGGRKPGAGIPLVAIKGSKGQYIGQVTLLRLERTTAQPRGGPMARLPAAGAEPAVALHGAVREARA